MGSTRRCLVLGSLIAACLACSEDGVSTVMLAFTPSGVSVRDVVCAVGHLQSDDEEFGAWLARLDDWTPPLEGTPGADGNVDIVCEGGGASHQLRFDNPRVEVFEGETVESETGFRQVVVPNAVLGGGFRCTLYSAFFHEDNIFGGGPQRRSASTLATPPGAEARTEQRAGNPSKVNNLVFLASGYKAAERPKWEADVLSTLKALRTGDRYGNTMPYVRYLPAINIFSVWQPSPESGASIPKQNITVDNNVGCTYGKSIDRLLTCNRGLLMDLAEVSDAKPRTKNFKNVVGLVLVNSDKYGGAGSSSSGFKYGSFYTTSEQSASARGTFAAIMFHELAHAWLGLSDEYTYGRDGPETGKTPNCISPSLVAKDNPWQHLIDAGLIPAKPSLGCKNNNWYRAKSNCLMKTLGSETLCPVCKESGTLKLYDTPTFSTTFPSCPLPDEVVHMVAGGEMRLHANKNLTDMGDFVLKWHLVKGSKATKLCSGKACTTELLVTADMLEKGVNTVRLTVVDNTPWVVNRQEPRVELMTQTRTFTLKLVDSIDTGNATLGLRERRCFCAEERGAACRGGASTFSNSGATDVPYYSECAAGGFCELHTTAYEREGDAATSVPDTPVPETPIPDTPAPDTLVPETPIPETPIPDTLVPETSVPDTTVPETQVPETQVPETLAPETSAPDTPVPDTPTPDASVPIPPTGDRSNETESAAVTLTATVTSGGATPPSTGVPTPQGNSVTSSAGERDANASSSLSLGVWVLIIVVSLLAVGALVAAAVVLRRKRKKPAPPSFMDAGFLSPTSTEMTSEDPLGVTVFTSKPVFTL
eukprot:Rhum_TRINITY_DN15167_c6_g1::Rhum_TRINITY_DN15167_c6_g1_i2::g.141825::m.141825